MARITVKVEGLRELERSMRILKKATARNALRKALVKAGRPVADAAIRNAPREWGDLEGSIRVSTKRPHDANAGKAAFAAAMRGGATRAEAGVAARAANAAAGSDFAEVWVGPGRQPQAITQEFGTEHHPAQPFMRPAWDAEKNRALDIAVEEIKVEVGKSVDRARRRAAKGK
ncbi:MAG: HK97-gp10 family putative phage morphogenesis protein [Pseudomonadota bacterium]|nr:HK97-gp10 family putative phage morphogenesis protein [Pseudomonadota bacterium]MEE3098751.1 HK97-gp10 family putative phage morphogenesis protein [Pseudomonadota bacterium]